MDEVKDEDFLAEVREKFDRAVAAEDENRARCLEDIKFGRLGQQWPERIEKDREADGEPCLVKNRMPSFIRQVVNEARQNRPSIRVIPQDSNADPETAEIISGLIRNIEVASDADVAYDTAIESAVAGGFGFFRINTAYTSDDAFDQDIVFERVPDALSVYGDPDSESVDGSDWNCAFVVKLLTEDEFETRYKGKDQVNWQADYKALKSPWMEDDHILVAEYWHREDVPGQIVALSDGSVVDVEEYQERAEEYQALGIMPVGKPRDVKRKKVTQYVLSGAEVLETVEWPGKFIPIIPVYGDEVWVEGKRHLKSLIHDAKDAQREHNYWSSAATSSIALAPRVPFIGPMGAFDADPEKWSTINDRKHPFVEYNGSVPPQRQPFAGPSQGELQQAMQAVDDMKAIMGIYDASLGERSNETSGVAIRQRQRQGNIATFHFIDNLTRSIRQAGRILLDLIGKVYTTERIIRVLGEDMEPQNVAVAPQDQQQAMQQRMMARGQQIAKIYDLSAGKYDLVVKTGPSYGSQRELAQAEIVEVIRAYPDAAPILGPMYLKNSDWPGSDEAAEKLETMQAGQQGPDPAQMQQAQQQMQQMAQQLQQMAQENRELKAQFALKARELDIKDKEADIKAVEISVRHSEAQTRMAASMAREAQPSNPFTVNGLG